MTRDEIDLTIKIRTEAKKRANSALFGPISMKV